MKAWQWLVLSAWGLLSLGLGSERLAAQSPHELVIRGGRVLDPETGLDAVRNVGIDAGIIRAISATPLAGNTVIDAEGLVVAPGFIDLHQHAWDEESLRFKAQDGVTSVLELEVGTAEVEQWYDQRKGMTIIHHGVSIGHIPVRMKVLGDAPAFLPPEGARAISQPATDEQIEQMAHLIAEGVTAGAVAVGFGLAYTPAASETEVAAMFRAAAAARASCHVHLAGRGSSGNGQQSLIDTARLAKRTGAALHIVHFQAGARDTMGEMLRLVEAMRGEGQDVSIEGYPWTAGMTEIQSAIFAPGFQERLGVTYRDIQWGATGERLDQASFERYRAQGGLAIVHNNTETAVTLAMQHPSLMIASDGLLGHPRNAGSYARVLGHYVREQGALELMLALRKMTLLPAQRLQPLAPMMARKGRVQVGCDADLTLFDPQTIAARATYEQPRQASIGIAWVLVAGTPVVREGQLVEGVFPGQALRSPVALP